MGRGFLLNRLTKTHLRWASARAQTMTDRILAVCTELVKQSIYSVSLSQYSGLAALFTRLNALRTEKKIPGRRPGRLAKIFAALDEVPTKGPRFNVVKFLETLLVKDQMLSKSEDFKSLGDLVERARQQQQQQQQAVQALQALQQEPPPPTATQAHDPAPSRALMPPPVAAAPAAPALETEETEHNGEDYNDDDYDGEGDEGEADEE